MNSIRIRAVHFNKQVKPPPGVSNALDKLSFQDDEHNKYDLYDAGDRVYVSHRDHPESMISVPIANVIRIEYFSAEDAPINAKEPVAHRAGPGRPPKQFAAPSAQ